MKRFLLPAEQGPVYGPITLQAHERFEARAAEEAAQMRHDRRIRIATQFLGKRWQLADDRPAHRPSKEDALHRVQRAQLAQAFASAPADDLAPFSLWLQGETCRSLCAERGWTNVHAEPAEQPAAAAGQVAAAPPGAEAVPPQDKAPRKYDGASAELMAVMNAWMHTWARDGTHAGWRTAAQLIVKVQDDLNHPVPLSTASRWLAAEKERYAKGGGLRGQPDLAELIKALKPACAILTDLVVTVEPPQTVFGGHLLAELELGCAELIDIAGFGPDVVAALAADVHRKSLGEEAGEASWTPSPRWCYWFMHEKLGLVPRRVTSHSTASPEQIELQERLHRINVDYVAIALKEGLRAKYIVGSDEFGQHFFPHGKVKWEKKGATMVSSDLPDDKRQFTGDVVHAADGSILFGVLIMAGKTSSSLPPPSVREHFAERMLFTTSPNHWANDKTKRLLLKRAWKWVVEEWKRDGLPGPPRCIYFLDCWPTNLTEDLKAWVKAECPGMEMRFIPAGATGKYQVNDTHLHKTLKATATAEAQAWRMKRILKFCDESRAAVAAGEVDTATA